jgi:hypothetical protein
MSRRVGPAADLFSMGKLKIMPAIVHSGHAANAALHADFMNFAYDD